MRFDAELTDTFGGEPNYTWVRRASFDAPPDASTRTLLHRAKTALRAHYEMRTTADFGDCIRADARHNCVALFIAANPEE